MRLANLINLLVFGWMVTPAIGAVDGFGKSSGHVPRSLGDPVANSRSFQRRQLTDEDAGVLENLVKKHKASKLAGDNSALEESQQPKPGFIAQHKKAIIISAAVLGAGGLGYMYLKHRGSAAGVDSVDNCVGYGGTEGTAAFGEDNFTALNTSWSGVMTPFLAWMYLCEYPWSPSDYTTIISLVQSPSLALLTPDPSTMGGLTPLDFQTCYEELCSGGSGYGSTNWDTDVASFTSYPGFYGFPAIQPSENATIQAWNDCASLPATS